MIFVLKKIDLLILSIIEFKYNRETIKYFEKKVLQTETERLKKEKENLLLKESIASLKRKLIKKDEELKQGTVVISENNTVILLITHRIVEYAQKMGV